MADCLSMALPWASGLHCNRTREIDLKLCNVQMSELKSMYVEKFTSLET